MIVNEVICRFGCPCSLHSDQGRNFESNISQEICKLLEIRKTRTSPRNPRCNGITERFNSTLLAMIRAYIKGQQRNGDLNLGCLAGAYRATPNESTTLTPNMMMLGREVRLPHEVVYDGSVPNKFENVSCYGEFVMGLQTRLQKSHEVARAHLHKAAETRKGRYDAKVNFNNFRVGDLVWMINETREIGVCPKLQPTFVGPYIVIDTYGDVNFKIQLDNKGKSRVVHHDKLKIYVGINPPGWAKKFANKVHQTQK